MDQDSFLTFVGQAAGLDRQGAAHATRATLETLGERVGRGPAREAAAELPPELATYLGGGAEAGDFGLDEFLRRVAEREGIDAQTAERHAVAVFGALGHALSDRPLRAIASALPREFAPLLPKGPWVDLADLDDVLARVRERAGTGPDATRRAIDAVLETLAERIAAGEARDLATRLPIALHPPLHRGAERVPDATRMSAADFLRRVVEREGVTPQEALTHTRAVLGTLREVVGADFFDVTVQLPDDYGELLAERRRAPT